MISEKISNLFLIL